MSLAACVAACAELLADEPELLADFSAALAGPRPRWALLPADLRTGLADIAWDHFIARGLVPADDRRVFITRTDRPCSACGGGAPEPWYQRCRTCNGALRELLERRTDRPTSLRAALVLAATDLAAAEALAREAAARLWPWRGRRGAMPGPSDPPRTVAWQVDERGRPLELRRGTRGVCPLLYEVLTRVARDRGRSDVVRTLYAHAHAYEFVHNTCWPPAPEADAVAGAFYAELAAEGAVVPEHGLHGSLPSRRGAYPPVGRPFAEFADPFAPLCGLWGLDVALERLEADTVVLAREL